MSRPGDQPPSLRKHLRTNSGRSLSPFHTHRSPITTIRLANYRLCTFKSVFCAFGPRGTAPSRPLHPFRISALPNVDSLPRSHGPSVLPPTPYTCLPLSLHPNPARYQQAINMLHAPRAPTPRHWIAYDHQYEGSSPALCALGHRIQVCGPCILTHSVVLPDPCRTLRPSCGFPPACSSTH